MERIQSEQQYLDTINSDGFTVIKFDTTWCPDCKNLERLSSRFLMIIILIQSICELSKSISLPHVVWFYLFHWTNWSFSSYPRQC